MDETIGAKGGRNDRRRRLKMTTLELKRILEIDEEDRKKRKEERLKKKKELERILRRNDIIAFIKISPLILIGNIIEKSPERKILREYEKAKKEDYLSNYYKESKDIYGGVVIVIKEGSEYKIIDSKYEEDNNRFLSIQERLNEKLEYKVKIETLKETKSISEEDKKIIEKLTTKDIIDKFDNRALKIKKELENILDEYIKITGEKDSLENIESIDDDLELDLMIEKTILIKEELKKLKKREEKLNSGLEFIDEKEDTLLEGNKYTLELDAEAIFDIDESIKEIEDIEKKLETKKEDKKDINISKYEKKKMSIEEINSNMLMLLIEQEKLIKDMGKKLSKSINYQDKLNIRFETINESTQRTIEAARNRMNGNGPFALRALSAISTMTLGMTRNILFPRMTTEVTKEAIIEDFGKEIESGIDEIESAIGYIDKNVNDIDSIINEIEELYPHYKEVDEIINNLSKLRTELESKKTSLHQSQKIEEELYKKNSEKILKKI